MKHSLTSKNKVDLVGDCSVCGPAVAIVKVGNGHGCLQAVRQVRGGAPHMHRVPAVSFASSAGAYST